MKLKLLLIFFLFFGITVLVSSGQILAEGGCPPGELPTYSESPWGGRVFEGCKAASAVTPEETIGEELGKPLKESPTLPSTGGSQPSQQKTQTTNVGIEIPNPLFTSDLVSLIDKIATWLLGIGSTIAVIVVLWAAFLFMTSGGSKDQVTRARQTLWYAVIGLTVLLLAKGVTLFIQNVLSGRFS